MSSYLQFRELCKNILPLLLAFFFALIFVCRWLRRNRTAHKNPLPSPPRLPVLGNLHQLGKAPHRSLHSLSRRYGELMLMKLGSKPTLVVSSPSAAREIMKTHDLAFSDRPKLSIPSKLLYDGKDIAFSNYGEYWRQMKSISTLQLLSNTRVRRFQTIREEETKLMLEQIRSSSAPSEVNLTEITVRLANVVVCRAAFGRKYSIKRLREINFMTLMRKFAELLGVFSVGDFIPWLRWVDVVSGLQGKVDSVAKEFDALLEVIFEDHVDGLMNQGEGEVEKRERERAKDLVDVLLEVQRDATLGFPIDRDTIKALILDMFSAGTDTTSTLMEWAMSEILRHPGVLRELQEEVRGVVGGKGRVLEADLEEMKYLKAVMKETLRLHPPLPLLAPREARQDVRVKGYDIKAKTQVIINAFAVQRDPIAWEEPEEFRPERFLDCSVDFMGHHFEFIPFGAGRRSCPGVTFGSSGAELAVASLVYAFDWSLPGRAALETLDMSEGTGLSIRRKNPLIVQATPFACE